MATGALVSDPGGNRRCSKTYAKKYPDGWSKFDENFRSGFKDGTRVVIKYTPNELAQSQRSRAPERFCTHQALKRRARPAPPYHGAGVGVLRAPRRRDVVRRHHGGALLSLSPARRRAARRRDRFLMSKGHAVHGVPCLPGRARARSTRGAARSPASRAAASPVTRRRRRRESSSPPARSATRSRSVSASPSPNSSTAPPRAPSCCSATASCRKARCGRRRCRRRASAREPAGDRRLQPLSGRAVASTRSCRSSRWPTSGAPSAGTCRRSTATTWRRSSPRSTRCRPPTGPTVLIAHTVKGKGVPGVEGTGARPLHDAHRRGRGAHLAALEATP